MSQYSIGIASMRGNPHSYFDSFVMDATGGPFVHSEIFLQNGRDVRSYTAVKYPHPCSDSAFCPTGRRFPLSGEWETIRIPVTQAGYKAAYGTILQLMALQLPYNSRDLWQCCIKLMLPFERDLDCNDLPSWCSQGVFCSQACLLILRRLAASGALQLPPGVDLTRLNSRGCSPNTLHALLAGRPTKKAVVSRRALPPALCPTSR
jgi:hypothetical protein